MVAASPHPRGIEIGGVPGQAVLGGGDHRLPRVGRVGKGPPAADATAPSAAAGGRAGSCQTTRPPRRRRSWEPAQSRGATGGPAGMGTGTSPVVAWPAAPAPAAPTRGPCLLFPPPPNPPKRPLLPAPGAASPAPAQLPLWPPGEPPLPAIAPVQTSPVRRWAQGLPGLGGGHWDRAQVPAEPPQLRWLGWGPPAPPHWPARWRGWGTWGDPSAAGGVPGLWATPLLAQPGCRIPPTGPSYGTKTHQE